MDHTPLKRFTLVETEDISAFEQAVRPIFGEVRFEASRPRQAFRARANFARVGRSGLYYGHYGAAVTIAIPHAGFIAQGVTLAGGGRNRHNGIEESLAPAALPAPVLDGARVDLELDSSHRHLAFCMSPEALRPALDALSGTAGDAPVALAPAGAPGPALGRFRRLLLALAAELGGAGASPPNRLLEAEQMLIAAFLEAQPHSLGHLLARQHRALAPWQVRRVEDYVEAHWDEALTLEKIAAAADAGVRAIQIAFRASRGCTPMDFVRRVRLRHAHRMLSDPGPATTVTAVAFACGFGNLGHFAKAYQLAFGELPSLTLARARLG